MSYQQYSHQDHGHPPLPQGWTVQWIQDEQQYMFINERTGQRSWHHPEMPHSGGNYGGGGGTRDIGGAPGPGGYNSPGPSGYGGPPPPGGRGYGGPPPPGGRGYGGGPPQGGRGYGGPPPPGQGYGSPPPPHGYGSPPPPHGYGSPAPPPGYGTPPPGQQGYGTPPPGQQGYGRPAPVQQKSHAAAYGIGGGVLGAAVGAWAMHEHDKRKLIYSESHIGQPVTNFVVSLNK